MIISNDTDRSKYSNVWVVAEVRPKDTAGTHELIGAARTLADKSDRM